MKILTSNPPPSPYFHLPFIVYMYETDHFDLRLILRKRKTFQSLEMYKMTRKHLGHLQEDKNPLRTHNREQENI